MNVYRCRFNVDTQVVPGGCRNGAPALPASSPQSFAGTPTHQDITTRDQLVVNQEALLNAYRCQFNIDTQIVPGGCAGNPGSVEPTPQSQYRFIAISTGFDYSCGIRTDQTTVCWGNNDKGQTEAPGGTFTAISTGHDYSCGLRPNQTAICWGDNQYSQLGAPRGRFTAVSVYGGHSCGLRPDKTIECWDRSGNTGWFSEEVVSGAFTAISLGALYSCGLRSDRTIECWKHGTDQLDVPSGTFSSIDIGSHGCGLRATQTIECWGEGYGVPAAAPSGAFTDIATDAYLACGIRTNQTIECWGEEGNLIYRETPSGAFTAIDINANHACGIRTNQTIECWGQYHVGQLNVPGGSGGGEPSTVPDAPRNLRSVWVGDDGITVKWTPPEDDGGSALTGYVVLIGGPGVVGGAVDVAATRTSYGFQNLLPDTEYTVWVAARNAAGVGEETMEKFKTERWCPNSGKFEPRRVGGIGPFLQHWRIFALKEFRAADPDNIGETILIEEGIPGGVVYDEGSLWQDGCAWIFKNAAVEGGNAFVAENAVLAGTSRLKGEANILGNAIVRGSAVVSGDADVYGNALVEDATVTGSAAVYGDAVVDGSGAVVDVDARVYEDARISGNARVYGDAWVYGTSKRVSVKGFPQTKRGGTVQGHAHVYEDAQVHGNAVVEGDAWVYGNAKVYGDAVVEGDARVYGDAKVFGNALVKGDAKVAGKVEVSGDALLAEALDDDNIYDGSDCKSGTEVCQYDGDKEYERVATAAQKALFEKLKVDFASCPNQDIAGKAEAYAHRIVYGKQEGVDQTIIDIDWAVLGACDHIGYLFKLIDPRDGWVTDLVVALAGVLAVIRVFTLSKVALSLLGLAEVAISAGAQGVAIFSDAKTMAEALKALNEDNNRST